MGSRLVKPQGKKQSGSEPRYGDRFLVSARQLCKALVNASNRNFERAFPQVDHCEIFVSALHAIHLTFAKLYNEDKDFMSVSDFLLTPVFVGATEELVLIDIPELMARLSISPEDFGEFWNNSKLYRERCKSAEERSKDISPDGKRIVRIDPSIFDPANWN